VRKSPVPKATPAAPRIRLRRLTHFCSSFFEEIGSCLFIVVLLQYTGSAQKVCSYRRMMAPVPIMPVDQLYERAARRRSGETRVTLRVVIMVSQVKFSVRNRMTASSRPYSWVQVSVTTRAADNVPGLTRASG